MAMMKLTVADVRREARTYLSMGMLTAQHPTRPTPVFRMDSGHRCAIGAALSEEVLNEAGRIGCQSIRTLWINGLIEVDFGDRQELITIMTLHDSWAEAELTRMTHLEMGFNNLADANVQAAKNLKQRFLDFLDQKPIPRGITPEDEYLIHCNLHWENSPTIWPIIKQFNNKSDTPFPDFDDGAVAQDPVRELEPA